MSRGENAAERNMLGVHLISIGKHVLMLKCKLLALKKMTLNESEEIHKTISDLRRMPDMIFRVDDVEKVIGRDVASLP